MHVNHIKENSKCTILYCFPNTCDRTIVMMFCDQPSRTIRLRRTRLYTIYESILYYIVIYLLSHVAKRVN